MGARKCRLALSVLYNNCDSWRRARGIGPKTLFKTKETVDPILQTAIFGQDLNFPILTCRTTSQPISQKNAQHFHLFFKGTSGMYPMPLGCGVYLIGQGLGFTPHSPGRPPWCHHHGGKACSLRSALRQTKTKEPNDVQILNMMQLESASKTQTAQYRAPRPWLHLPKNNSHKWIRCNGDVNVTEINSKTKINGCNGSREDGTV